MSIIQSLKTPFFVQNKLDMVNGETEFKGQVFSIKIDENKKTVKIVRFKKPSKPVAPVIDPKLQNVYRLSQFQKEQIDGIDYKEFKKLYVKDVIGKEPSLFNSLVIKVTDSQIDDWIEKSELYNDNYELKFEKFIEEKLKYNETPKENVKFLFMIREDLDFLEKNDYYIEANFSMNFYLDAVEIVDWVKKSGLI